MKQKQIALAIILIILVVTLVACSKNDLGTCEHVVVMDEAVSATCTEKGLTEGKHCSKCGEVFLAQTEVPTTNHTYSSDCDTICNVCEHERVSSVGHTYDHTCDTTCNECGAVRTIDHTYDHTYDHTCDTTCNECGATRTINHTYSSDCDTICNVCGATRTTSTAHSDVNPADNNCDACGENSALTFTLSGDGQSYAITGANLNKSGDITLPSTYNGKPVTTIGKDAFSDCTSLTSITIPDSVTSIGSSAFNGCSGLTSITIPFVGAKAGETSSDTYQYPFGYIFGTSSYTGGTAVEQDYYGSSTSFGTTETYYIPSSLRSVTITGGNILSGAFENCSMLTSVNIGYAVTTIGKNAFYDCSNLESVTFGENSQLTTIGSSAFYDCDRLTFVTIPDSVTTIGSYAFYSCDNLESVSFGENSQLTTIGSNAFYSCDNLESVSFCENSQLTTIGERAFYNCDSLTSITIPDSVTTISALAFYLCSNLTSITIPDSVTTIEYDAFIDCDNLESVTFGENSQLTTIENWAFYSCDNLTSITIPNSVTSIGDEAFSGCDNLTSVTIPDSVTTIGSYAFKYCDNLTIFCEAESKPSGWDTYWNNDKRPVVWNVQSVFAQDGITYAITKANFATVGKYIGTATEVTIPSTVTIDGTTYSVTSIRAEAFADCTSLTSITIPDSVTSIGSSAFSGCSGLTSITIPFVGAKAGVTSSDTYQYPFGYIFGTSRYTGGTAVTQFYHGSSPSLTTYETYYIPSSLHSVTVTGGNILYGAFYNCDSLTSITIPDSVTSIGSSAFSGCSGLTSITIPFVGAKAGVTSSDTYQYPFGYIFGTSSYAGGTAVKQYYYGSSTSSRTSNTYYIPSSLRSVTVTGGNILHGAFYNCDKLISITIPNSVTSIGESAFYDCDSLTTITIPDSVTSIGDCAFWYCDSLTSIVVDENNQNYKSINGNLYSKDGSTLIQYAIGKTDSTFTIPDSVTSIGDLAFADCTSLTSIVVDENNQNYKSIDGNLYSKDGTLLLQYAIGKTDTTLTIPNSVTSIGKRAFYDCDNLESVTFGENSQLTTVGAEAFYNCDSLTSITIPDSVTTIGSGAFSGCSNLTSITIPDSVKTIGSYAFGYCTSLTSITIPDSVTSIGNYAFSGCSNLTIYCEAKSKPSGWESYWNYSDCPVVWGYKEE